MTGETNKAIVRRYFEIAWNQRKYSELDEIIAPNRIHHFGSKIANHGPSEVREMMKNWLHAMPDYHCYIQDMIAEGDRVVSLLRFTGTQTGAFEVASRTLTPGNAKVDDVEIFIMRLIDGKIVESWAAWDRLSVLEQLGAIEKPTQV